MHESDQAEVEGAAGEFVDSPTDCDRLHLKREAGAGTRRQKQGERPVAQEGRLWHEAGDGSADFSWYTKRGILAAVYSATLLYWLRDDANEAAVEAFLDRRLQGVAQLGKLRASLRLPWQSREKPAT